MEKKIEELVKLIYKSFEGVRLGDGISWREAHVIDDYGSAEAMKRARAQDEQNDWTKIPFELIGKLHYQGVLPFLDSLGLKFYLPICMLYVLAEYKVTESIIVDSLIYTLTRPSTVEGLKKELNESQVFCAVKFLKLCLELEEGYLDTELIPNALENIW